VINDLFIGKKPKSEDCNPGFGNQSCARTRGMKSHHSKQIVLQSLRNNVHVSGNSNEYALFMLNNLGMAQKNSRLIPRSDLYL
jgi:hypothetical protein